MGVVGVVEEEDKEGETKEIKEIREIKVKIQVKGQVRDTPGTRPPGMRTCRRSSPASGTGPMANLLIFVWSRQPAPGRIILFQSQIIRLEKLTSSALKKYKSFIRLFRK